MTAPSGGDPCTRVDMDEEAFQVAEWKEPICPMKEVASLSEYSEGHFPPLPLYHNGDHFNLLVPDTSRLITCGLLGRAQAAQVKDVLQTPPTLQLENEWKTVTHKSNKN